MDQLVALDQSAQLQPQAPPTPVDQAVPSAPQSVLDQINRDELSAYILNLLRADIRDREEFGWAAMREYDQLSYDGYKKRATTPWNNASNYAVCLTPTLVDTAHANVMGGIWADKKRIIRVDGVGPEDQRIERPLESVLNWQVINDIDDAYDTIDKTVMVSLKNGNGCIKCIQGYGGPQQNKVLWVRIPIENIFVPINATGAQIGQTDHVFELIPMSENDKKQRETLKGPDGKPVYDGIDALPKGNRITMSSAIDQLTNVRDITGGTSLGRRYSNDTYYILECYLTYWFTPKDSKESVSVELIVWISPQGGTILRMVENKDIDDETAQPIRPYSLRWIPYPRGDRLYGDSLPWMIKQTQEELDHAHNQNMNAAEELVKPYKFYDPGSGFDPEANQQTPNGWYPVPNPRANVYIPDMRFDPIFERSFELYWEYAQRRTGLTELFQGRQPQRRQTLGEAQLRVNKTEIRFKSVYERFEMGFKELITLTYFYDRKYMPRDTKIKVLGATEYQTIDELFPQGMRGRFNFSFHSSPLNEKAEEQQNIQLFVTAALANPLVINNASNQWRLLELLARSHNITNLETLIGKPKEANVLSPQEAIQRIMSGQMDVMPDPGIDPSDYMLRIAMFMKSDAFKNADPQTQQAIMLLQRRVDMIRQGQVQASMDAQLLRQRMTMEAQGGMGGGGIPGGAPPSQGPGVPGGGPQ